MNDGSYLEILKKYSVDAGAITPADVVDESTLMALPATSRAVARLASGRGAAAEPALARGRPRSPLVVAGCCRASTGYQYRWDFFVNIDLPARTA